MTIGEPKLNNHYFLPEDQHLFDYHQIFSVSSMWIELGMENIIATYDLYIRDMPKNRNFFLFGGLEEIIENIKVWGFTKEEVNFLTKNNLIKPKTANYFLNFKFDGDIWAMPEGTIFFNHEPVVRLTGPIWKINLLTMFLMNALSSNTIFMSKLVRSMLAAKDKLYVVTCSGTRAQSHESSLKFGRAAYILDSVAGAVPSVARKFNLPVDRFNTKAYHAFIKSFPSEIQAMRAAASIFPDISPMIDTYGFRQGLKNAIIVAKETKTAKGKTFASVTIDSGKDVADFARQAKIARRELDKNDLKEVEIVLAGNFDEQRISELIRLKAPVDAVIVVTALVTSSDEPKLEVVLKLSQFVRENEIHYAAKLTPGKESYPGKKQVFRKFNKKGKILKDIIGLENEKELGVSLLKKYMSRGKQIKKLPTLDMIKKYTKKQLEILPNNLKQVDKSYTPNVTISKKLKQMFKESKKQHLEKLK